jgi:hypothetical protein
MIYLNIILTIIAITLISFLVMAIFLFKKSSKGFGLTPPDFGDSMKMMNELFGNLPKKKK